MTNADALIQPPTEESPAPLSLSADSPEAAIAQAACYEAAGNLDAASALYRAALAFCPDDGALWKRFANVLILQKNWTAAVQALQACLQEAPTDGEAWRMLAGCLIFLGEHDASGEAIRHALRYAPGVPAVHVNHALWLLKEGRWWEGFEELEWDYLQGGRRLRHVSRAWNGHIYGAHINTVFLWAEQGLGDTLMLVRIVPVLQWLHPYVTFILEVQAPLVAFLAEQLPGVRVVAQTSDGSIPFDFDAHIGLFSLPRLAALTPENLTLRHPKPYLTRPTARAEHWRERLTGDFKVGFSWAGNRSHANDVNRSLLPEQLDTLVELPGISFYCLQRDVDIPQEAVETTPSVTFLSEDLTDVSEVAGVIANLDLVITVDSAIAHLAGAMGKPVWVLLSKSSDWRWLKEGETTPWYSTMRLFRQEVLGDWDPVLARVQAELETLAKERG